MLPASWMAEEEGNRKMAVGCDRMCGFVSPGSGKVTVVTTVMEFWVPNRAGHVLTALPK